MISSGPRTTDSRNLMSLDGETNTNSLRCVRTQRTGGLGCSDGRQARKTSSSLWSAPSPRRKCSRWYSLTPSLTPFQARGHTTSMTRPRRLAEWHAPLGRGRRAPTMRVPTRILLPRR